MADKRSTKASVSLHDDDHMMVSRGGQSYKISGAEMKASMGGSGGGGGGGGGVDKLLAGGGISISPANGEGTVTITNTRSSGGSGTITQVKAGTHLSGGGSSGSVTLNCTLNPAGSGWLLQSPNSTVRDSKNGNPDYIEWNSGNKTVGTTYFISDVRIKKDIAPTTVTAADVIKQVEFISYSWSDEEQKRLVENELADESKRTTKAQAEAKFAERIELGFKAQQLKELYERFTFETSDGTVNVNSNHLLLFTMKALQEALARIEALEAAATP